MGIRRQISVRAAVWTLFVLLLLPQLRVLPSAVRNFALAQTRIATSSEEDSNDNLPLTQEQEQERDASDLLVFVHHQRVELHAPHVILATALLLPSASDAPVTLRWRTPDNRSPRAPPLCGIPARAPPIS